MIKFLRYLFCAVLIASCFVSVAQEDGGKQLRVRRKNPRIKTRVGISPVVGLYFANKNHTSSPKPKMAFNISLKEEIRLNSKNTDFLMLGIEYMYHGVSFNSYYFYSDSLQLYTKNRMRYKYHLNIQELNFPILLKHSFQKETNTLVSSYIFAGYSYRRLLSCNLKVDEDGNIIEQKPERLVFKNPGLSKVNNSFLLAGIGIQKNTLLRHNAIYGELQFRYSLSPFYFSEPFTASSLYINGHFVFVTIGFKF